MFSLNTKKKIFAEVLKWKNPFGVDDPDNGYLPFIETIWAIDDMPSEDNRFNTARGDIIQHTLNNDDWDDEYLFIERLKLFENDNIFKKFIETIMNPVFRESEEEILEYLFFFNEFLDDEGLILHIVSYTEDNIPVYELVKNEEYNNLPLQLRINRTRFYVEKEPSGRPWFQSSHKKPKKYPSFVLVFNNGWNDYGLYTKFVLFHYENEQNNPTQIGRLKIMSSKNNDVIEVIPDEFEVLDDSFCSIGETFDYYYYIRDQMGKDYQSTLYAIKDAAIFPQIQDIFEDDRVFQTSLMRNDETERVLREVRYRIREYDMSDLYSFEYTFEPPFSKTPLTLDFNFKNDDLEANRIYALIGENGTGKTQLISSIPNSISKNKDELFHPRIPIFSKIIAVSYSIFDKFQIPKKTASFNYIYSGLRNEKGEPYSDKGLILRFHNSWKTIQKKGRINKWRNALLNFMDEELIKTFILPLEEQETPGNSYKVNIAGFSKVRGILSSGQNILLYIVTEIVANLRLDSLILFDEPETHLHPKAISRLVNTIYQLVNDFKSYCIIATHSPLIVRELLSKNVYIIERVDDTMGSRKSNVESFGQNLSVLTDEVFGNKSIEKQYKRILSKYVQAGLSYESVLDKLESEDLPLSLGATVYLKSLYLNRRNEES